MPQSGEIAVQRLFEARGAMSSSSLSSAWATLLFLKMVCYAVDSTKSMHGRTAPSLVSRFVVPLIMPPTSYEYDHPIIGFRCSLPAGCTMCPMLQVRHYGPATFLWSIHWILEPRQASDGSCLDFNLGVLGISSLVCLRPSQVLGCLSSLVCLGSSPSHVGPCKAEVPMLQVRHYGPDSPP